MSYSMTDGIIFHYIPVHTQPKITHYMYHIHEVCTPSVVYQFSEQSCVTLSKEKKTATIYLGIVTSQSVNSK